MTVPDQVFHDREGFCTLYGDKILRDHGKATETRPGRQFRAGMGNSRAPGDEQAMVCSGWLADCGPARRAVAAGPSPQAMRQQP